MNKWMGKWVKIHYKKIENLEDSASIEQLWVYIMTQLVIWGLRQEFTMSFILLLVFLFFIYNTSAIPRRSLKYYTNKEQKIKLARKTV